LVTIEGWKRLAVVLPNERDRGILAGLTLTYSSLAGNRLVWEKGLEGWNVIKSPYLEELRELVRADGNATGQMQQARATIISLGKQKFGKAATKKQRAELDAIADLPRLERMRNRLLSATSWADLLATP